jgi:hypothetical protein
LHEPGLRLPPDAASAPRRAATVVIRIAALAFSLVPQACLAYVLTIRYP